MHRSSAGLRFSSVLRKSAGRAGPSHALRHRRHALSAGGVQQLQHSRTHHGFFFQAGGPRNYGGYHPSRAQPDLAREPATRGGVGGTGLRSADDGLGADRILGRADRTAPRFGCSNIRPCTYSPPMPMIWKSVSRFFPVRARPLPKSAARKSPKRWSKANPRAIITNQPLPYFPRPVMTSYKKN